MRPAPVIPRADDEEVVIFPVRLFEPCVSHHGSEEIFLVEPAGHVQVGHGRFMQRVGNGVTLPEIIVAAVVDEIVPRGNFAVKVFFVGIRKRAKPQIPLEHIEPVKGKTEIFVRAF